MVKYPLVVVNPRTARVVSDPDLVTRIRQRIPAENLFLGRSPEELYLKLREARAADIDTLVVVGGDGTTAAVLTSLLRVWPHSILPKLVLAGGGSANSIARSLGLRGSVEGVLDRLLDEETRSPEPRLQPLLRIRPAASESYYGLSLLAGAPKRWLEGIEAGPGRGLAGRTAESLRTLASVLVRGERARELAEPVNAEIEIDGRALLEDSFTALAISVIGDLGLAVTPFQDDTPAVGSFHVGLTPAGPARLSLEVPLLTFGLTDQSCVEIHEANFVTLRFAQPTELSLDTVTLPATELLTIEPGPSLPILNP
ncbi:MAG: hypothetical protein GY725_07320 [bacterium]|nr:hypothetical protein [bacterium]